MQSTINLPDVTPRKILLFYRPNSVTSRNLYEWALENYLRPLIDHVILVSVIKMTHPTSESLWPLGLLGYDGVTNTYDYDEYFRYLRSKEDSARKVLGEISCELRRRNITSSIMVERGNGNSAFLNACGSIKPDIILIGSPSKKRKSKFNCFSNSRSLSKFIENNPFRIPVVKGDDVEKIEGKDVSEAGKMDDRNKPLDRRLENGNENTKILNKNIEDEKRASKKNLASQRFIVGPSFGENDEPSEQRSKVCEPISRKRVLRKLQNFKQQFSFGNTPTQKHYNKLED